ncbi:MAG: hypothetical protein R3D26_13500 [Cyanobacteriota/Melainabacteria group bacterium]
MKLSGPFFGNAALSISAIVVSIRSKEEKEERPTFEQLKRSGRSRLLSALGQVGSGDDNRTGAGPFQITLVAFLGSTEFLLLTPVVTGWR